MEAGRANERRPDAIYPLGQQLLCSSSDPHDAIYCCFLRRDRAASPGKKRGERSSRRRRREADRQHQNAEPLAAQLSKPARSLQTHNKKPQLRPAESFSFFSAPPPPSALAPPQFAIHTKKAAFEETHTHNTRTQKNQEEGEKQRSLSKKKSPNNFATDRS